MKNKVVLVLSFALMLSAKLVFAWTEKSDKQVAEAWEAWEANHQQDTEKYFQASVHADPQDARAHLGLALLYRFQGKTGEAWRSFERALNAVDDVYPYIYSGWLSQIRVNLMEGDAGAVKMLHNLTEKADAQGILSAMANEILGGHYQRSGDLAKSQHHFDQMHTISEWTLIGPFDNISASGFNKTFPPESEYDFSKTYEGKNGVPAAWFKFDRIRSDRWIDFRRYFAYFESIFYANNFVYSPTKRKAQIRVGTSGALTVFLNDELLYEYLDENNNDLDTYIIETELQAGWNRLLLKCGFSEIMSCNFMVRITDAKGNPLDGLKVATDRQDYDAKPQAPREIIANFAERYFKERIEANPDYLENYVLLANVYLRNDKAIEAELALKNALKRAPNCALFYTKLLEAFQRGEKEDEVATTLSKIELLDKHVPVLMQARIEEAIEQENFDKAGELIATLEGLLPQSAKVYEYRVMLNSSKSLIEKVIEQIDAGHAKFPKNWTFAYLAATMSIQKTNQYDEAIAIYEKYLEESYTETALVNLANMYLKSSKIDKWEDVYEKIFEIKPAGTGYYNKMAETYFSLQDYDKAEEAIEKVIELCPNSSSYWQSLGNIRRVKNEIEAAKAAYETALAYQPTNYEVRQIMRDLDGKKSIFQNFESVDVTQLIKNAPTADTYPAHEAIILLNKTARVVYEKGASESSREMLIKVFNSTGIDDFKEYWIEDNGYGEATTVEKAVVIKQDGAEINADVGDNHVVFKSLEENDCIYLKWKTKNYYSGKLSSHFWDTIYFNDYYPIQLMTYSLMVPPEMKFNHKAQNMELEPSIVSSGDGKIYNWTLEDEPGLRYEVGMPGLEDVGKILHISSIEDWQYMVDWYSDLAQTKTKSSHEIKAQVDQLFESGRSYTENEKIDTIYNFITENIRYSSVSFRQSGLVPQKARDVLVNKIGDCKDMTTLCITMLEEVGIKANYVLVNTVDEGRNAHVLPSISFNHCIAGVETGDGLKYLDLTAYNYASSSMPQNDVGAFSLLIKPETRSPAYLSSEGTTSNNVLRRTSIEVLPDNSMLFNTEVRKTGIMAAGMRDAFRFKDQSERKQDLVEVLSRSYPGMELNEFSIDDLSEARLEVNYAYSFKVPDYVMDKGRFKFMEIPWTDALEAGNGLSSETRTYPYYYWQSEDTLSEEIEIVIPGDFEPIDSDIEVSYSCSIADYSLSYHYADGVIKGIRRLVNKKRIVQPEEYPDFREFYNKAIKQDTDVILLQRKETAAK